MSFNETINNSSENRNTEWDILLPGHAREDLQDKQIDEMSSLFEYDDNIYDEEDDEYYNDDYEDDNEYFHDDYEEDYCEDYGNERTEFIVKDSELIEMSIPTYLLERYDFIKELPDGIAVMGGVARSIAREVITGEREPIRDIDLVNIVDEDGVSRVDNALLEELSKKYMPDDYKFGHGIQSNTLMDYFNSRDFTVNESIIYNGKLLLSEAAYNDFQENIIRPTYCELPYSDDRVRSRIFLKAIMMRCILLQISDTVPLIEDMNEPEYIGEFDIALFLNKAMGRNAETARCFTRDLTEWDIIPEEYYDKPMALASSLLDNVYSFEFRPSNSESIFNDPSNLESPYDYSVPRAMEEYYSSDLEVRRTIMEYEDNEQNHNTNERLRGNYSQEEFDLINAGNFREN